MNETFCSDVTGCSSFECDDFLCWDGQVLRPNFEQWITVLIYVVFRVIEQIIFAYLAQINRELLQITVKERKAKSSCCFHNGISPTGIYKQVSLRFLGTLIGVLSFILILERNIWMFVSLIFIDSFGVYVISLKQHKDISLHTESTENLTRMQIPKDITTRDVDEQWLDNMRKFLADSSTVKMNADVRLPLLKFL